MLELRLDQPQLLDLRDWFMTKSAVPLYQLEPQSHNSRATLSIVDDFRYECAAIGSW